MGYRPVTCLTNSAGQIPFSFDLFRHAASVRTIACLDYQLILCSGESQFSANQGESCHEQENSPPCFSYPSRAIVRFIKYFLFQ